MKDVPASAEKLRAAVWAVHQTQTSSVRACNRLINAVQKELEQLGESAAGRDLLVALASSDRDAHVKIVSANAVMAWDRETARASLEQIVRDAGAEVVRPMTMDVALRAPPGYATTAALSLLNLNRPFRKKTDTPAAESSTVESAWLDAAERLFGLAMNGGLQHAFDVARVDFPDACAALIAIGAIDAAAIIREANELLQAPQPSQNLDELLCDLDSRLAVMQVMEFLEAASEW